MGLFSETSLRSGREGHSTHESGPAGNTLQIGTLYIFILQTLMDELSRSSDMSNSNRSRWKITEQTIIRVRINLYNIHSAATRRR